MQRIVFLFNIVPLINSHLCHNAPGAERSCNSSICFAHFYTLLEGTVERFDCVDDAMLSFEACAKLLNATSTCLKGANQIHCCCDSPKCNADFQTTTISLSYTECVNLMVASLLVASIVVILKFIGSQAIVEHGMVLLDGNKASRIRNLNTACIAVLMSAALFCWCPATMRCVEHALGRFQTPWKFVVQIMSTSLTSAIFVTVSPFLLYYEISMSRKFKIAYGLNRKSSISIDILLALFVVLAIYEPFNESLEIWDRDEKTLAYCRYGYFKWTILASVSMYTTYVILLMWRVAEVSAVAAPADDPTRSLSVVEHPPTLMSMSTATRSLAENTDDTQLETLTVSPRPFHVARGASAILNVTNNSNLEWVAMRALLSTTGFYALHPTKFLIPPGKQVSIEVRQITPIEFPANNHSILIEWFSVGWTCPNVDINRLWSRPYLVAQNRWKFFVLPIYLEV
ncbi:unnamed protein product [Caenorhabditis bovis]|uniref:MSP domain-containing protein n=1 Tax=Caenorhabditis bovis TaxID=2654633 RepID=A0A8S1F3A0_9PELO|nr:unnamed protein product [Caenorhabditis bovis]